MSQSIPQFGESSALPADASSILEVGSISAYFLVKLAADTIEGIQMTIEPPRCSTGMDGVQQLVSRLSSVASEQRVLILAPVGKDARLLQAMLVSQSIVSDVCADLDMLIEEIDCGVAALLIAEEALPAGEVALAGVIERQPPWSDLPILLLTRHGEDSCTTFHALESLGNVTLLERPVRASAVASAVRSAIRARARQYQTRAHLVEREQADRRKDEFLATLAHELRNPLAPIRNSVQVMRLSSPNELDGQLLEIMDRQVNYMVRLVDDLLELSRITRGKIELRKESVELREVIATTLETLKPLIAAAGHELTVASPAEPLVVEADPTRLGQIFTNLIDNAAKYTNAGGHIDISMDRDGDDAVVRVSDTGIGISAEALSSVFDMFVQIDNRESRGQSGLGIGLTLVRSLIELHGGTIEARSAGRGSGSEFEVRLPLTNRESARANAEPRVESALVRHARVLVVDDNHDAADSLGSVLRVLGLEVRVEYDGESALAALEEFDPTAIFLDLGMPGMDGYETAARIRARREGKKALLVALTGWGQDRDRARTGRAGFDKHLVKPAGMDALQSVLAMRPQ